MSAVAQEASIAAMRARVPTTSLAFSASWLFSPRLFCAEQVFQQVARTRLSQAALDAPLMAIESMMVTVGWPCKGRLVEVACRGCKSCMGLRPDLGKRTGAEMVDCCAIYVFSCYA